uniref:Uncharacterized protein n=1 Tax=Timema genevievae TaxID=629358 RepID=A0A7R9PMR0_TIMGE|nr:unnamed protein product [Timema genevievae]
MRLLMTQTYKDHQDKFHYLNQGESSDIDDVSDMKTFQETLEALTLLGFSAREQVDIFRIMAAILHLGNVKIVEATSDKAGSGDSDGSAIAGEDRHLAILAELLELDIQEMRSWLCHRKIVSMKEVFFKAMTVREAIGARDALAKHIYAELFNWIVVVINKALENTDTSQRFIGVLDIYGFETFEINSFEQFCINYANEKLQQQFNQASHHTHVFKLEQEEYLKEEIEWKLIDFYDNQPCIDLIETKLGILDLLDEECRMPKGTDSSWAEKLYSKCTKWKHFAKPRFGTTAFLIHHFADNVTYQSNGFLEKNRDTVMEDQINVLKNGQVGSQFRDSLNMLMGTLNATTPHYVRCIKPNDEKQAFEYNPLRAVQQLRACGVLETIRISAAGFPSRSENDKYQFGKTKIFFRAGQVAYLEKLRADKLKQCCIIIQKQIRMFICRKRYLRMLQSIKSIQRYARGFLARRRVYHMRQKHAATTIQRHVRGWLKRVQFTRTRKCIQGIQAHARGMMARRRYKAMLYNHKGMRQASDASQDSSRVCASGCFPLPLTSFPSLPMTSSHTRELEESRESSLPLKPLLFRTILCSPLPLSRHTVHAWSIIVQTLPKKIVQLPTPPRAVKENSQLKTQAGEVADLRSRLDSSKGQETKLKQLSTLLAARETELADILVTLKQEQDEKMDLLNEKERAEKENRALMERLNEDNSQLKAQLNDLNEKIKSNQIGAEENLKVRLEQEKSFLINEQDQDRDAYQKLLAEYNILEQRCEVLDEELSHYQRGGAGIKKSHNRSHSNTSSISAQEDTLSATSEPPEDVSTFLTLNRIMNQGISRAVDNSPSCMFYSQDFGYGSVRSTVSASSVSSNHQPLEIIEWNKHPEGRPHEQIDVGLVLKLQSKLKNVEKERIRLQKRVEEYEKDESPGDEQNRTRDTFKLQELEMENEKLRDNLIALRKTVAEEEPSGKELLRQLEASQEELNRRRDECIQLHSVLANQTKGLKSVASNNYSTHIDIINEDGELVLAFEAQKKINRQLEDELQAEKIRWKSEREDLQQEIERLKEDNDRQQKILSVNLTKSPQSQQEAFMQHEITRLTSENLDLQEKFDTLSELCRKHRKQMKQLAKKLKEAGVMEVEGAVDAVPSAAVQDQRHNLPMVKKKEREYQGMFEYRKEDEQIIVRHLIHDLKPRIAVTLLPGLPSYILFMCIRHTDFINDDEKVRSLLTATINAVKKQRLPSQDLYGSRDYHPRAFMAAETTIPGPLWQQTIPWPLWQQRLPSQGLYGSRAYHPRAFMAAETTIPGPLWQQRLPSQDLYGSRDYHPRAFMAAEPTIPGPLWQQSLPSQGLYGSRAYHPRAFMAAEPTHPRTFMAAEPTIPGPLREHENDNPDSPDPVIKRRHEDLETTILWLSNTLRLLHNLKQYSGDKTFQAENTPKQNEQCLKNFDLSEYRQVLSDIAVWIYQGVIRALEERVQPMVVPAILEHEAIPGLPGQKPMGMRGRSTSVVREIESPLDIQKALDVLLHELKGFHRLLSFHGVDPELIVQVFRQICSEPDDLAEYSGQLSTTFQQPLIDNHISRDDIDPPKKVEDIPFTTQYHPALHRMNTILKRLKVLTSFTKTQNLLSSCPRIFYFICASSLNNLLLRKDLCHWSKGMQIRYNLSHLEQWVRDHRMQARKQTEDVQSVCDMCDRLSMFQIIKILNLYTPADDFEERVPIAFIRKIQTTLSERTESQEQSTLLMDTKFSFPVRFPFNPSKIRLEDIEVPEVLNLPTLKKV